MISLARLRLLRELARRGTMTAVGQACGLSSSAVSQQFAILEREAGLRLLEPIGRRVRLTSEGERLLAHAERIFLQVEAAEEDLRAARAEPRGELAVACFPSYAKARLVPALAGLRARHPHLRLVLHEIEPTEAAEALAAGRCDLAVTFAYDLVPRPATAAVVAHDLLDEPVLLALPPRWADAPDPLNLALLADEPWIIGSHQSDDRILAERACALSGFSPRLGHRIDDYDLVLRMIAAGEGIGFVPQLAFTGPAAAGVAARRIAARPLRRRIQALARPALAGSPAVRALLAALAA